MSEVPVQVIVSAFQDERSADEALKKLKEAKRENLIGIVNAAVLRKDVKGKLYIKETANFGGKAAVLGGVTGAAIGLIAGPMLLVPAAVGALVGGLASKLRDHGFSDERLKMIGEGMTPGSSVIVAVVEHTWVAQVQKAMAEAGADAVTAALSADIAAQLEAGHESAYSAIASEEGFKAGHISVGEDALEGGRIAVDDSGVYGGRFYATQDGFVVEGVAANEAGVETFLAAGIAGKAEETPGKDPAVESK
jgi:uncharacterized membrane protein